MIEMKIDARDTLRELGRIAAKLKRPRAFMASWGNTVVRMGKRSARSKSKGGGFWLDIADHTRVSEVSDDHATVVNNHFAAAHKEFGGEIRPKKAKALTIPITSEAKGKRASGFEMGGRELFTLKSDNPDTVGILGYADDSGFKPLFVLRTRVRQNPEPWWPKDKEVERAGLREANWWYDRQIERAG